MRAKIERGLVCPQTAQVFERPDHASRAHIDAAVAVLHVVIHGMRRPEPLTPKCSSASATISSIAWQPRGVPGQRTQWDVPRLCVHKFL